jgi:hypothetical protein
MTCVRSGTESQRRPDVLLRNCTRTFNFQWERDHQQPQAPFPYRPFVDRKIDLDALPFPHDFTAADPPDYIDILMGFLMFTKDIAKHDELWIPKSREMMTSWTVVGHITWHCQFRPQIELILQSEDDLKAMGNIKYAYTNQPQCMKQMHPLACGEEGFESVGRRVRRDLSTATDAAVAMRIGKMRMILAFSPAGRIYGVHVRVGSIPSPQEEPYPPAGFPTGHWPGS